MLIRLSRSRRLMVALCAAVAGLAAPAAAQQLAPPPPMALATPATGAANSNPDDPAFADLLDAMNAAVEKEAMLDAMSVSIAREYAKIPPVAALEREKPGLIGAIVLAMRPVLKSYGARVQADYRPRMQALMAQHLTPAEAQDLTEVYRSPIGLKLMGSASRNLTMDNTLSGVADHITQGKDPLEIKISRDQVAGDIGQAATSAVKTLSDAELGELGRLVMEKPALLKLGTMQGAIIALRTQMENEQPNAAEVAEIEKTVIETMRRHLGK